MPANLTPAYYEAEEAYRQADTIAEKQKALRRMLAVMPKHKGTDHLRADLRTRMAKLRDQAETQSRSGSRWNPYTVRKEGAGQVALVGLANAGKSHLMAALTGAKPRIADYPYSTLEPQPAMLRYENVHIQLVDLPPIDMHHTNGWIRSLIRQADVLLVVLDLASDPVESLELVLEELTTIGLEPVVRLPAGTDDEVARSAEPKRVRVVGTHLDLPGAEEAGATLQAQYGRRFPTLIVSVTAGDGLDALGRWLFAALDMVRVYTRAKGQKPDYNRPVVLRRGATLETLAAALHIEWMGTVKYAQVWGNGKFDGQHVSRTYVLEDGDTIELRM